MTIFLKGECDEPKIYVVGDRAAWCEDCYGVVVATPAGFVVIHTDDGVDRITGQNSLMATEKELARRGVVWK